MAMASIVSYRLSLLVPASFSLAFNDYGFELVSDSPIDIEGLLDNNLLTEQDLLSDLKKGINVSEMARRKFRDIAVIGGLVFQGTPSQPIKSKHLQSVHNFFMKFLRTMSQKICSINKHWMKLLIMVWNRDDCCKPLNASNAKIFVGSKPTNLPLFFSLNYRSLARQNVLRIG